MEFLVEFETHVPGGTPKSEVKDRRSAEAAASAQLGRQVVRVWQPTAASREAVGLHRADSAPQLDSQLSTLPMHEWMPVTVIPLAPRPNDPGRHR